MNIEARLIEKVGEVGGKLHTARSRNDQVALDLRLFTKEAITDTLLSLKEFQQALISLAEANKECSYAGIYPFAAGAAGLAGSSPSSLF